MASYPDIIKNIVCNISNWDYEYNNYKLCIAPRTKEQFYIWIKLFFGVYIPWLAEPKCNEHDFPFNAMWEAYAEITPISIWYANRSGGKTFDLSMLTFIESIFKPNCGINILGGSLDQAQKAIGYLTEFWDYPHAPRHLLINNQVAGRGYKLKNGSWVKALAASSKSVRGSHQPKLRIDEVDELDEKIYNAALGQPKKMHGIPENIIISSTLHQPFGLMSDIVENKDKTGAKLFKWCVNEVKEIEKEIDGKIIKLGFWSKEEIEKIKKQVPKAMFDSEYLCKRPKLEDCIFDWESVDRAYKRRFNMEYDYNLINTGSIDWGYTCTVLHIIQDKKEFIDIPNSYSWECMELNDRCHEIIARCIEHKINIIYCDSNPKDNYVTLRGLIKKRKLTIYVIPVDFSVWKDTGINVCRFYLERNLVNIKDFTFQDKLKKYHYKPGTEIIDKKDDHYPDALIAWAATKWRILGYLTKEEIKKMEEKEKRTLDKIHIGTY